MRNTSSQHDLAEAMVKHFWTRRGFHSVREAGCDVFSWRLKNGRLQQVFSEIELSTRNVVRNYTRNQSCETTGGFKHMIFVPNERLRGAVRRVLRRYLSAEAGRKVGIILLDSVEKSLAKTGCARRR